MAGGEYPCAYYQTAVPIWFSSAIVGATARGAALAQRPAVHGRAGACGWGRACALKEMFPEV